MDAYDALRQLDRVKDEADLLYSEDEVEAALERMASDIGEAMADSNPVILCVLLGGIVTTGKLLSRLPFACELSYVHATRYANDTEGGELVWAVTPYGDIKGRNVLIVDDILDQGHTLHEIERALRAAGAASVRKAVLVRKQRPQPAATTADFVGLTVPNRYVFGYGMDYKGYWRNLPAIYAVAQRP